MQIAGVIIRCLVSFMRTQRRVRGTFFTSGTSFTNCNYYLFIVMAMSLVFLGCEDELLLDQEVFIPYTRVITISTPENKAVLDDNPSFSFLLDTPLADDEYLTILLADAVLQYNTSTNGITNFTDILWVWWWLVDSKDTMPEENEETGAFTVQYEQGDQPLYDDNENLTYQGHAGYALTSDSSYYWVIIVYNKNGIPTRSSSQYSFTK